MEYQKSFLDKSLSILVIFLIIYTGYALLPLVDMIAGFLTIIFYPFIIALILYYLMRPIVGFLNRKLSPYISIALTFCALGLFLTFIIIYLYPIIERQVNSVLELPSNYPKLGIGNIKLFNYQIHISDELRNVIPNFISNLDVMITKNIASIIEFATEFVVGLVVVPFVLFYFLKDDQSIYDNFCKLVPKKSLQTVKNFLKEIDLTLIHFINGRMLVSLLLSTLLLISFLIIGIDYPFVLFLFSLTFYIIPTVGAFIATIPPLVVGFSMSTAMGVEVMIIMFVASLMEGVLITPRVMGSALYIHPITIILLLWIGGLMYGILGLIIVTPMYALAKIVIKYIHAYTRSRA